MTTEKLMQLVERFASARVDEEVAAARDAGIQHLRRYAAKVTDARAAVVSALTEFEQSTIRSVEERPF